MQLDLVPKNSLTTNISLPKGSPMIAAYLNGWKNTLGIGDVFWSSCCSIRPSPNDLKTSFEFQ